MNIMNLVVGWLGWQITTIMLVESPPTWPLVSMSLVVVGMGASALSAKFFFFFFFFVIFFFFFEIFFFY